MVKNKPDPLLTKPAKKFLFDVNDFDDRRKEEEPEEPPPPPPPVFSEEEMERARREAHQQGRREAGAEAEASREKKIADLLQVISREFSTLFATEDLRNAQYEAESVRLTLAAIQKLFPAMTQKFGLGEIQRTIVEVLENQREQPVIKIEVGLDYVESIQDYVQRLMKQGNMPGACQVSGNPSLGSGDCRLSWEQGGALRDSQGIAEDIERHMQVILAERPRLRDNRKNEPVIAPQPALPPDAQTRTPTPAPAAGPQGDKNE
ncbi:MAG: hypothetical protein HYS17_10355 [Micavibrio aeruginosavorus]|uniref:Flagellar assembly protein FliH/Type III secretion system HrpE domain-containing protein n=1 Tax=Micavibrio aeruginosavorus TaxID=349221 RepID=A0A7T5R1M4_9BACT|nr:MAG: hypothetical protein HYS17_10355 [Micavibrio aeruginosavorus]